MALNTTPLTPAAATNVSIIHTARDSSGISYKRIYIYGTFGGATATLSTSPDGGTTKFPELASGNSGTALSLTAAGYWDIAIPCNCNSNQKPIEIYVTLASGSPALVATVTDVN